MVQEKNVGIVTIDLNARFSIYPAKQYKKNITK